ncbi:glycerol-3-phosphate dehydrogenase/oxidase [Haematomicrobium sanguinis]|uniref:glycerol-3-phosphate dehydrogenase/oxidase n=1 Tax=Haematomicrobium sanguinis TaxID=479106 RepID=UPI000A057230|nr:glycerol-3-phosphate dehydrogenase/oxidase [Haematomicrobium sanguinis]
MTAARKDATSTANAASSAASGTATHGTANAAAPTRSEQPRSEVAALKANPKADVLIIGGGINGVGTFRDLAMQGVNVALVERGDYCQGASGASSHMIHGGIRYLENGEFRLVKESVEERNGLLKIAPHYVKPLQTSIPIFSTFSGILSAPLRFLTHKSGKPTERGAFLIKAGLTIYDFFSRGGKTVPRHQFMGAKKAKAQFPQLREDVKYVATYFDASVHDPERLTLDVLKDGLAAHTAARASNYVSAVGHQGTKVILRDEVTGDVFDFEAPVVINMTGAWVDQTNGAMGSASRFMGGTKGSHIVLDHPELLAATRGREIFFEHSDGRIVLIYPMGDRILVGTTDIDADMDTPAVCTEEEVDYFFDLIHHVFPAIRVTREDIVYRFSGVRPLPRHDDTQPGFVSRDYRIEKRESAGQTVMSLVGGKWTTFRALSEHVANEALAALGLNRSTTTSGVAIGGGRGFPATPVEQKEWVASRSTGTLSEARVAGLLKRYGTRADEVIAWLSSHEDRLLSSTHELSTAELSYLVAREQVAHIEDVLIRRTSLAFRGLVSQELVSEIAEILAGELGWDKDEQEREIVRTLTVLEEGHQVRVPSLIAS